MASTWWLALGALALAGCSLTHPLDKYGDELGVDAAPPDIADADGIDARTGTDAPADAVACAPPTILEPTALEKVGAAIHLRVSAPSCLTSLAVYLDGKEILQSTASTIDQWVPVAVGTHTIGVNGWTGTGPAHVSVLVSFTRPS